MAQGWGRLRAVVGIAVGMALAAGVAAALSMPAAGAPAVVRVGSGTTLPEPYMVPLYTLTRDILAQRGISLEFVNLSTDEAVEAALDRNRIDVALLSTVGLNRAASRGLHMKFIVGYEMQNTFVLATRSDVQRAEDLKGKTVAVQSRTSLSVAVAVVLLRKQAGLEPGRDYRLVFVPGSDSRAAAMEAGSVDAAVLFRNVAAQLAERTGGRFRIYGGLWDVLPPMLWEGLGASDAFRANRQLAIAFVRGVLDSYREFYRGEPEKMAAMKRSIPGAEALSEEELAADYALFQKMRMYPEDGGLAQTTYDEMIKFLLENDQIEQKQVVTYGDAVDASLLQAAREGR